MKMSVPILWAAVILTATAALAQNGLPAWAFLWDPTVKVPPADDKPNQLAGSNAAFSWKQARDLFFAPDWHPDDHPAMPEIVANGRKPDVRACGSCHRVEGTGGPENASLAGLPESYLVQQLADFKSGARKMSGPERPATQLMMASVKAMTDAEVRAAAAYFSAQKPQQIIKVVESESIPKTGPSRLFFVKSTEGGSEILGPRIVEMPDDVDQFELRDSRATFTAYVPVGSLTRGETLAKTGGSGITVACGSCHGPELKGVGDIPPIAGRSPTYIVRQLHEFQSGGRVASASSLMQQTVEKLSQNDMIALAAYVASLSP
ncbi:c-type cytochrome [Bradyrhizobium sp. WSM471]|uniref:c-type cytochrome n=1 Tax=Bradyrhizobium sp. WSM471 TaxID=319017 RepID=UPI00024D2273|nr:MULTISPECIES: c-type cytochrome [Bradyrhizobium]EHR01918.1 cytochrome c553 [Bradyrhizobium sp. WSM471]UFW43945.1 c-type cytochrome [Bradyrhizobium canariense]